MLDKGGESGAEDPTRDGGVLGARDGSGMVDKVYIESSKVK